MSEIKKIIIVLVFVLIGKFTVAQGWIQKNNTYAAASGCSTFAIGDTGYVVAGAGNGTWTYDTLADSWAAEANYPGVGGGVKVGFALNGRGYVGTGTALGYAWYTEFYQYDPNNDKWTTEANFAGLPRGYAVAFVLDGKGYVGLGVGGPSGSGPGTNFHAYKDFYAYNPSNNTWEQIANYPGKGSQFNISFTIGDKAYVGCGETIDSSTWGVTAIDSDFWEYDTTSKVWTRIANFAGGPRSAGTGFSTCGNGFVGLGYSDIHNNDYMNDFWQYTPFNNTWTPIANYGGAARALASSFIINNSAWVGMGFNNSTNFDDWWEYHVAYVPGFSANNSVCQGGTVTFTDTSTYSPDHWSWQFPGGTPDTSTQKSITITYDTAGSHNVILTAWNSCDSGSQTFTNYITVGAGGVLSILPPHDIICTGQSVSLVVKNDIGANFAWTPSAGLNDSTGDSVVATPMVTTTYFVTGTGSGGCGFQGIDSITVNSATPMTILPQDTLFCSGQSATLYVSSGGSKFMWNPSTGLSADTGIFVVASPTLSTTYTVTGLNSSGCADTGTSKVIVVPSPNKPTFYQHGDTLISSSKYDNQWYLNGTMLNNDTSQDIIITSTGNYWVNVVNEANGCSTTSDTITIDTVNGINRLAAINDQVSIYPNPFTNEVSIKINSLVQNIKDWNLQVTDVLGRTIYSKSSMDYSNDIDLSSLSSGMYFITVVNKTGKMVFPVVKQNY